MFNITFYSFSKKLNSTARPNGTGETFACQAKGPLDKLNPVMELLTSRTAVPAWNYAVWESRYYRVTGWTMDGPLWVCNLAIDALATWRDTLGNQSIYVYRSSYSYDGDIMDTLYPTVARFHRLTVALPRMWAIDGGTETIITGHGTYVVGIAGDGHTRYYAFTEANLETFLSNLFAPAYYDAVLGAFGAIEYPEAKVAINPLQYISRVMFFPCGLDGATNTPSLHYIGQVTAVKVGPVQVAATAWTFLNESYNSYYYDLDITGTDFRHPQADTRGDYLQLDPFTSYEAFIPPWGLIRLDSADLLDADYLRMRIVIDVRSDSGVLTLSALHGNREIVLCKSTAKVGLDCPLSQIVTPGASGLSIISGIASAVDAAFTGNIGGLASGLHSSIGSAVSGNVPHLSIVGSQSSGAAMAGAPHLLVTHRYVTNDDLDGRGRPLCAVRQISTIPGYILGDPDELSLPCTGPEMETIRAAVAGGFYWE